MATMVIADDDVSFAEYLNRLAQHHGYQVRNVDNGRALLAQLEQAPVELCAIEIFLPELDGLELIPQIRRRYPDTKILAMCDGGIFGPDAAALFLKMAQLLGAHDVLVKPFALPDFLRRIHALLAVPFPMRSERRDSEAEVIHEATPVNSNRT